MLEGRGIDFESIGLAWAYRRSIESAYREIDAANESLRYERAMRAAALAGRLAQIAVLEGALQELDPDHPLLLETGRVWASGERQRAWQTVYDNAYDAVARARGIACVPRALTPAGLAEAAVLAEAIEWRTVLIFFRRPFWRDEEYVSVEAAERARAKADRAAREAVEHAGS